MRSQGSCCAISRSILNRLGTITTHCMPVLAVLQRIWGGRVHLTAQPPVVRTKPVIRWKSLYDVRWHFSQMLGITQEETSSCAYISSMFSWTTTRRRCGGAETRTS